MTNQEFSIVLQDTIGRITSILGSKAQEYAKGDRLHNFNKAAALANTSREMALRGMLAKHIISVWDLIDDQENGVQSSRELWDEKIIDSINYLVLLRAMIYESHLRGDPAND